MNTWLIDMLDGLNKFLPVAIVIVSALVGYNSQFEGSLIFGVMGLVGGILSAAVICGMLAALLEIERHLRKIAARTS